ncbi:hypothetical protein T492DRAFT_832530 [Pavlovales sp. CCMP2436]|nr:hypothetical protein T492DRAFT_832530 [Pavlovales sp. CCMP2436]
MPPIIFLCLGLLGSRGRLEPARALTRAELGRRATLVVGSAFALSAGTALPTLATPVKGRTTLDTPELRGLDRPEELQVVRRFIKLPSGVNYAELKQGAGGELVIGSTGSFQWVLRRADGYYVDGSEKHDFEPVKLRIGNADIGGLDEALRLFWAMLELAGGRLPAYTCCHHWRAAFIALRTDGPLTAAAAPPPPLPQVGMRQGGVRRVLVPVPIAGSPSQISSKLGLEFGPRRRLERQLNRPGSPGNILFFELSLEKVQPASS